MHKAMHVLPNMLFSEDLCIMICKAKLKGAIQVLRDADGAGGVSEFPEKNVTKV